MVRGAEGRVIESAVQSSSLHIAGTTSFLGAALRLGTLCCALIFPGVALAQDAGDDGGTQFLVPDAMVPDASVGEGGADRDQQEGEDSVGRVPTTCRDNDDCSTGFSCHQTRCVYTGIRRATGGGCLGAAPALLLVATVAVIARRRRP